MDKSETKMGYVVFGKTYEYMLKNKINYPNGRLTQHIYF
jgi:hypothetical protein